MDWLPLLKTKGAALFFSSLKSEVLLLRLLSIYFPFLYILFGGSIERAVRPFIWGLIKWCGELTPTSPSTCSFSPFSLHKVQTYLCRVHLLSDVCTSEVVFLVCCIWYHRLRRFFGWVLGQTRPLFPDVPAHSNAESGRQVCRSFFLCI